jgi:hypothetical protein
LKTRRNRNAALHETTLPASQCGVPHGQPKVHAERHECLQHRQERFAVITAGVNGDLASSRPASIAYGQRMTWSTSLGPAPLLS